jgi:hypothetical protein
MTKEQKIIDTFERVSYDKFSSHAYSSAYLGVALASAIEYLPEYAQKTILEYLERKTIELQGV